MTEYELDLKRNYEALGYKFLYDTIAENRELKKVIYKAAYHYDIPAKKILSVQGECVHFDVNDEIGTSRWLIFKLT